MPHNSILCLIFHAILYLSMLIEGRQQMKHADRIRSHGRSKYVLPASNRKDDRFSIRVGDVVREMGLRDRAAAVCSALKSREFLEENNLQLLTTSGPPSGLSTTVTYTYQFIETSAALAKKDDAWKRLRGALQDIFAEVGGGEAYLRDERAHFSGKGESR
jgi:hypothetical protein